MPKHGTDKIRSYQITEWPNHGTIKTRSKEEFAFLEFIFTKN